MSKFQRLSKEKIDEALGDIKTAPEQVRLALTVEPESKSFIPIRMPEAGDWLAEHSERGQSWKSFGRVVFGCRPHSTYDTIYLQPVGSFDGPRAPSLATLKCISEAFFLGLKVSLLAPVQLVDFGIPFRMNQDHKQYLTADMLSILGRTRDLRDSRRELCSIILTMEDIYPDEKWNFVYGLANIVEGKGVWSFARLDPEFYGPSKINPEKIKQQMQRRAVKILLHELTHLFGLKHCIYYTCLMNGANHEQEMDSQPVYLCPICLRKLHSVTNFDAIRRYQQLLQEYNQHEMFPEAQWYKARLLEMKAPLEADESAPPAAAAAAAAPAATPTPSARSARSARSKKVVRKKAK